MKGCAEGIPDDLIDITVVSFNCLAQYRVVARVRDGHRLGLFLPQARAAFDIGEEESDGACREGVHKINTQLQGKEISKPVFHLSML